LINYAKNANYDYHNYEVAIDCVLRNHGFSINRSGQLAGPTLGHPGFHHMVRARAAAISYTTED